MQFFSLFCVQFVYGEKGVKNKSQKVKNHTVQETKHVRSIQLFEH
jgi:hypothetical protein